MSKTKWVQVIAVVCILAVLPFVLAACGGDEESAADNPLVGTWLDKETGSIGYSFNADGTMAVVGEGEDVSAEYEYTDTVIKLMDPESDEFIELEYMFDGETLIIVIEGFEAEFVQE